MVVWRVWVLSLGHICSKLNAPTLSRPVEQVQSRNPSVSVPRSVPPLTEAAARTALLRFVATRHCYGSRAAAELHIQELRPRVTYRVRTPRGPLGAPLLSTGQCPTTW